MHKHKSEAMSCFRYQGRGGWYGELGGKSKIEQIESQPSVMALAVAGSDTISPWF